jgi:hypothetical protein
MLLARTWYDVIQVQPPQCLCRRDRSKRVLVLQALQTLEQVTFVREVDYCPEYPRLSTVVARETPKLLRPCLNPGDDRLGEQTDDTARLQQQLQAILHPPCSCLSLVL